MKRAWAGLIVVALLSGCWNYRGSRRVATVGGVTTLVGIAALAVILSSDTKLSESELLPIAVLLPVISVGVVLGVSGLISMGVNDDRPTPKTPAAPELSRDECLQQRSARLKRAHEIADAGQRTTALLAIPLCEQGAD